MTGKKYEKGNRKNCNDIFDNSWRGSLGIKLYFFGAPKSKATGETINLSFTPATATVAANADFTVTILAKPSLNTVLRGYKTKVSFDKAKLNFKSIRYKVGVVSAGLGNTTAEAATVNTNGFIDIVGEDATATGYTLELPMVPSSLV